MHPPEIWYVSYGSNMCRDRLNCYLAGGRPSGAAITYRGARDPSSPRDDMAVTLPGRVYFAGESSVWGGGVALYDHDSPGPSPARAYKVTVGQFADVAAQEMHRVPDANNELEGIIAEGLGGGRHQTGQGLYETMVEVGFHDGLPMLTFTSSHGFDGARQTQPNRAYLAMLARGLRESHGWSDSEIEQYFHNAVSSWPKTTAVMPETS